MAAGALAALGGFLVIGFFGSLLEAPRLPLLLGMTVSIGLCASRRLDLAARVPAAAPTGEACAMDTSVPVESWRALAVGLAACVGGIALALAALVYAPFTPYDLRALAGTHRPWLNIPLMGVALTWMAGGPVLFATRLAARRMDAAALTGWLLLYLLAGWFLVRLCVPDFALHKILGTQAMHWPWEWELMGRFAALAGALAMTATAAALAALATRMTVARTAWLSLALVWLPAMLIGYQVVVVEATTDNLIELMAGQAAAWAAFALLVAVFVVCIAAGALACLSLTRRWRGWVLSLAVAIMGLPVTYAAAWVGIEQHVHKYGKVFSGLQFLLSMDRSHYAGRSELLVRFTVVYVGSIVLVGLVQAVILRAAVARQARVSEPTSGTDSASVS